MAFHYTIAPSLDLVYIHASGDLFADELEACVAGYIGEDGFHSGLDVLLEAPGDANVRFTDAESFERLHRLIEEARVDGAYRIACASASEEVCEAIHAIAEDTPAQVKIEFFDTAHEALVWLQEDRMHEQREEVGKRLLERIRERALPAEGRGG